MDIAIRSASQISLDNLLAIIATPLTTSTIGTTAVRLSYENLPALDRILHPLGLMTDHKAGLPRTSYRGVITFSLGSQLVYIVPIAYPI